MKGTLLCCACLGSGNATLSTASCPASVCLIFLAAAAVAALAVVILLQGLGATILRNTPANAVYLGTFEVLKGAAAKQLGCKVRGWRPLQQAAAAGSEVHSSSHWADAQQHLTAAVCVCTGDVYRCSWPLRSSPAATTTTCASSHASLYATHCPACSLCTHAHCTIMTTNPAEQCRPASLGGAVISSAGGVWLLVCHLPCGRDQELHAD